MHAFGLIGDLPIICRATMILVAYRHAREYTVFNVDQCQGLPDRVLTLGEVKVRNTFIACRPARAGIRIVALHFRNKNGPLSEAIFCLLSALL